MTIQTNAAHPLTDEYVNAAIQQHGYGSPESVIAKLHQWIGIHGGEDSVTLLMYEAHKALSALRAPVADARLHMLVQEAIIWIETGGGPAVSLCADLRAALASAPVAGKAHPSDAEIEATIRALDSESQKTRHADGEMGVRINDVMIARAVLARYGHSPDGLMVDMVPPAAARDRWMYEQGRLAERDPRSHAAPQASEAVRIAFPTHLRKMWSGGEVQAWLDEHHGVKTPQPSAKGSMERFRKWQAEQATARSAQPAEEPADFAPPTGANPHQHCVSGGRPTGRNES